MKAWKALRPNRMPCNGGSGQWPRSGRWLEVEGGLEPCQNGLHLCRKRDLLFWLGPCIWECEYEGEVVRADDKLVVRRARLVRMLRTWNAKTQRLFACDCAERVLSIYEVNNPGDNQPRNAIDTARSYARGEVSNKKLAAAREAAGAAAWEAAGAAAREAAGAAAWYAAWAAAREAAGAAAGAAAREAAWYAAWAAARYAARAGERKWQARRLWRYLEGSPR